MKRVQGAHVENDDVDLDNVTSWTQLTEALLETQDERRLSVSLPPPRYPRLVRMTND